MKNQLLKTGGLFIETKHSLICQFPEPRLVLSTSSYNGGFLMADAVFNHCIHSVQSDSSFTRSFEEASNDLLNFAIMNGFNCERITGLLSNTKVDRHGYSAFYFQDTLIEVIATAVIGTNAMRAGEHGEESNRDCAFNDAINLLVLTNSQIEDGNMVKALLTITEAKSAALQELAVINPCTLSPATGTGADGIIFATNPMAKVFCNNVGTPSLFGEALACAVKTALKESLAMESKIIPWRQSRAEERLWRLGMDEICSADLPFSTAKAQVVLIFCQAVWQEYCWGLLGIDGLYQLFSLLESPVFQPGGMKLCAALRQKIAAVNCTEGKLNWNKISEL